MGRDARGFNISTANKLLVLIDGRSVYSPLFSGTFWDVQDQVFDDIDRIEVIRGPGGATWGANAMNGVINIISKDVADTRGSMAVIAAGSDDHAIVSGRWSRRFAGTSEFQAQAYFDRTWRRIPEQFEETRNTVEVDTQHRMQAGGRHDLVFG